jgi:hypothetical protein
MVAQRYEGVLQWNTRGGVGVDVPGCDTAQSQPVGECDEHRVAGPVPRQERALELDAQPLGAKGFQQGPHSRDVVHAMLCTTGEADEALAVGADRRERDGWWGGVMRAITGVRVGDAQQAAEVAPATLAGDEQREVASVVEAQLGAVDWAQPEPASGLGEFHRAPDAVMVGEREGCVAELERCDDQLLR